MSLVLSHDEILHTSTTPVPGETPEEVARAAADVVAALRDQLARLTEPLGLAAPQIGWPERVFVVASEDGPLAFINPALHEPGARNGHGPRAESPLLRAHLDAYARRYAPLGGGWHWSTEGCFTEHGDWRIPRRNLVIITFISEDGHRGTLRVAGRHADVVQHEVDHLNGITLAGHPTANHLPKRPEEAK